MPLVINTNVASLNAQRNLGKAQTGLRQTGQAARPLAILNRQAIRLLSRTQLITSFTQKGVKRRNLSNVYVARCHYAGEP